MRNGMAASVRFVSHPLQNITATTASENQRLQGAGRRMPDSCGLRPAAPCL